MIMELNEVMELLESKGTEQNRKVYRRHGYPEPLYGNSFADLRKLGRKIGTDHGLAKALWNTRNSDARILATIVADPSSMSRKDIEALARDIDYYTLADEFAKNIVYWSGHRKPLMENWIRSKKEWIGRIGWTMLSLASMDDSFDQDDRYFIGYLSEIEARVHDAPNRQKDAMNNAMIAIGSRNEPLRRIAIETAKRIGKISVDHGETWCKTPYAIPYIERIWERKARKGRK